MEKSALQIARAAYQPKLPKALQGAVKVKEGAATQSVGDQEEIKKLFPNTYGMPIVEFEPATEANTKKMNVGIILSGGQAPGGHNVITGLFDQIKKLPVCSTRSRSSTPRTVSMVSSLVLAVLLTTTTWSSPRRLSTSIAIPVVSI